MSFLNYKDHKVILSLGLAGIFLASGLVTFPAFGSNALSSSIVNAPARITVHPNPATPGAAITVVGYNFPLSQTITITFNNNVVGTTKPSANGQFSSQYTVPATLADGSYIIRATDSFGDDLSTVLTVSAGITLKPVRVIDGRTVTITGAGFSHSSTVTVTFDSKAVKTIPTSSTGTFSLSYTIPMTTLAGVHNFVAKDSAHTVSKSFTTISKIVIAPKTGQAGTSTALKASGFGANLGVTLTFNGASLSGQKPITANSTGGFSLSFTVPMLSPGTYTVKVTDSKGDTSSSLYTIT
jgi:hypothetical protein